MTSHNAVLAATGVFAALLGAALAGAAAAAAEAPDYTILPPAELHQLDREYISANGLFPFFESSVVSDPYQILDGQEVTGTFDVVQTHLDYPVLYFTYGLGGTDLRRHIPSFHQVHEEVSDPTGTATGYDGAVHDLFWFATNPENADLPDNDYFAGSHPFVFFGNEYWETPLGSANYVTVFGSTFALFDTFPDSETVQAGLGVGLEGILDHLG